MRKKQEEDYAAKLKERHEHWEALYVNGGHDPFYADGVNLNLTRNHIMSTRRDIKENYEEKDYPPEYFKPVPPEVPDGYVARADEIRASAQETLKIYEADPDYRYILEHRDEYSEKTLDSIYVNSVLGYAAGLKLAIEADDLVTMRRHERPESYLDSFKPCAEKMRTLEPEDVQMTLSL